MNFKFFSAQSDCAGMAPHRKALRDFPQFHSVIVKYFVNSEHPYSTVMDETHILLDFLKSNGVSHSVQYTGIVDGSHSNDIVVIGLAAEDAQFLKLITDHSDYSKYENVVER